MSPRPPADAVVALRSLPRRFRGLFAGLEDDESPDDLAHRTGRDGQSAVDHIAAATTALGGTSSGPTTVDDALAALSDAATALADQSEHKSADEWAEGEGDQTALDHLWRRVDHAVDELRSAERTLAEVRGR